MNVILIVDDEVAVDKTQQSVLALTTPSGVQLFAITVDSFIDKYKNGIFEKYSVMVITKDTEALVRISKAGIKLPVDFINIGGMHFREGRVQITKSVSVTPKEIEEFLFLNQLGYKLEYQQVLTYEPIDLVPILKKLKKGE